jgi:molybdopterin-guanine dinucleotide biosynthesis protein A
MRRSPHGARTPRRYHPLDMTTATRPPSTHALPVLHGLVLAGGRSTRMGQDKARLHYGAQPQLEAAFHLLQSFVEDCRVSVRADQQDDPLRARFPRLVDLERDIGPAAGLLAAHAHAPHAAWLAVACDLPLLDAATLATLVAARAPGIAAASFRSDHDGLAEPLCAIWEPAALRRLAQRVVAGRQSLRGALAGDDVRLLSLSSAHALDNANTPSDHQALLQRTGRIW